MENLQRRVSGIYVVRLTVPARMRHIVGKREFVATTGTQHLPVAKLVAATMLARWRLQLMDLERLALANHEMNHDSIIKIADGHPLIAGGGYLPLEQAAAVLGLTVADILRSASEGRLGIFHRFAGTMGYLMPLDARLPDDSELGTLIVPNREQMPVSAVAHAASGVLAVPEDCVAAAAASLLVSGEAVMVMFAAPNGDKSLGYVPDDPVKLTPSSVEVSASDLERLRRVLAAVIDPERIATARAMQKATLGAGPAAAGKNADRLFSAALDAYAKSFLPQKITSPKEIERIRTGIALFIEFEGDLRLADIDAERLRSFRDERLSTVLARENKVRIKYKTKSMSESIRAVAGTDWPKMSADERNLRMQWIARMLNWLKDQKWISDNPATALVGESVENKSERRLTALLRKPRLAFSPDELSLIFNASWFKSGKGELTKVGTYREFSPFRYWLPLLGVYAGARINELCQLRLEDVCKTDAGTWYIDINENTADKSLKRQKDTGTCWSKRKVPLHPALIDLGFIAWCERLREEGFKRVFPELSWNAKTHYAKEPIRAMSEFFFSLGMPRDNTKVFHSFRHGFNNAIAKPTCTPEWRKRLMGHEPGAGVNEQSYLADPTPDESIEVIKLLLDFTLPEISRFDVDEGVKAISDALRRKNGGRGGVESLGGVALPWSAKSL
ncbi:MAG: site-specific integrase [Polaromonas sp.]|nr:site-specific integrase [Polaromonas sp.]